jgi:hypothetical protein
MMLLRADRSTEAEQVFRDLKRFPDKGGSLRGLELDAGQHGRIRLTV